MRSVSGVETVQNLHQKGVELGNLKPVKVLNAMDKAVLSTRHSGIQPGGKHATQPVHLEPGEYWIVVSPLANNRVPYALETLFRVD